MPMMRRMFAVVMALAVLLTVLGGQISAQTEAVEITLIHDTHVHGNLGGSVNIAHKAGVISEIRSRKPNSLFVGNGDDLATSVLSSVFKGSHVVDAFNVMGLAVNGVGNHDFDYGPENFAARAAESKFPWVTANLVDRTSGEAPAGARRYVILEVAGVKLGFTSLAPADTAVITTLGDDIQVLDAAAAMKDVVGQLRTAGADLVVLLSHVCPADARRVAQDVPGIDVIVGDHCANVLDKPEVIGNTIISRVGDEYKHVGELTLRIQAGKLVGHEFSRRDLTESSPQDPTVAALVQDYNDKLAASLGAEVGTAATALDAVRRHNRMRETALGNWVADQVRLRTGADIAFVNGGNIRADKVFAPGTTLTKKDIIDILPFTNYLSQIGLTGGQVRAALELSVSTVEAGHGRFLQISGLQVRVDLTRPVGERVTAVYHNGYPLDPQRVYRVALPDFLAGGGDGYELFKGTPQLVNASGAPLMSTTAIEALAQAGSISPRTEGRILYTAGVKMTVGKAELDVLGVTQPVAAAPMTLDGAVYLPLADVADLFGRQVMWDGGSTAAVPLPWWQKVTLEVGSGGVVAHEGRLYATPEVLARIGIKAEVDGETIMLGFAG